MTNPNERERDVEAGEEKVEEVKLTTSSIEVKLDNRHIHNLAMLSGILGRSPSEIVCNLLDAAFPDHLLKKWEEEARERVRKLQAIVHWE